MKYKYSRKRIDRKITESNYFQLSSSEKLNLVVKIREMLLAQKEDRKESEQEKCWLCKGKGYVSFPDGQARCLCFLTDEYKKHPTPSPLEDYSQGHNGGGIGSSGSNGNPTPSPEKECKHKYDFINGFKCVKCGEVTEGLATIKTPTPSPLEIEEIEEIRPGFTINGKEIMTDDSPMNKLIRNQKKLYQYIKEKKI